MASSKVAEWSVSGFCLPSVPSDGWLLFSSNVRWFVLVHSWGALLIQAWRWGHGIGLNPINIRLSNRGDCWDFSQCVCVSEMDRLRVSPHCIAPGRKSWATVLWTSPFRSPPLQIIDSHTVEKWRRRSKLRNENEPRKKLTYPNYHPFLYLTRRISSRMIPYDSDAVKTCEKCTQTKPKYERAFPAYLQTDSTRNHLSFNT